jgi:hypothetical protein
MTDTNAELLTLLGQARSGLGAELERRLLAALASSTLYVPVDRDAATGAEAVRAAVAPDGARHLVCFTSPEEFSEWAGATRVEVGVIAGHALAALAAPLDAAALWIDPVSVHGGRLARDRVDLVARLG